MPVLITERPSFILESRGNVRKERMAKTHSSSRRDNRLSGYLDVEAVDALQHLQRMYPLPSQSDFVNAALKWLRLCAEETGLNGNLMPDAQRFFPKGSKR